MKKIFVVISLLLLAGLLPVMVMAQPRPALVGFPMPTPAPTPLPIGTPPAAPVVTPSPTVTPAPLPSPTPAPGDASTGGQPTMGFEYEVLRLTNEIRVAHGLNPLLWCDALAVAARVHSEDMGRNDFISHTGSDGSSPTDRAVAAGWERSTRYMGVGENAARGQRTPQAVVDGWMNSPGHRDNILRPTYTYIGIGYVYRPGTRMPHNWTQKFH